jgi:hypothetical protein
VVEFGRDSVELILGERGQVGVFVQILAQQPVGVLVGAALPGMMRTTKYEEFLARWDLQFETIWCAIEPAWCPG